MDEYVINYRGKEYYFVSDICSKTGMQRTYIYYLLKKKTLVAVEKEGIRLILKASFDEYYKTREKKISPKTELIKKIKDLDESKIKQIKDILDKI